MKGDRISRIHMICRIVFIAVLSTSAILLILTGMLVNGGAA